MRHVRRIGLAVLALLVLGVGGAVLLLVNAHLGVRSLRPPLPEPASLFALDASADLPTGLFLVETARQPMPRKGVLDPTGDPHPDATYVMTHPGFVLAWPDGRLFLIDVGMDRESALAFGAPLERYAGAGPIEPLGSVAERLGPAAGRLRGIAFTHLHTDHTAGLDALCTKLGARLPLFQTSAQHDSGNYTTRSGRAQLAAADCVSFTRLPEAPLAALPGFPGLFVIAAAGHTPGSQIFVAHVRAADAIRVWILTGDVVNHRDAIAHDLPKPWLYSLLVVPEDAQRLARLRRFLAELAADPRVRLAVSHDAVGLAEHGAPAWPPFLADPT